MPHIRTVSQIFKMAKNPIDELYFNIDLLEALSNSLTVNGVIADFALPATDANAKWISIVNGMVDIFTKMKLNGLGAWNTAESSPAVAEELINSYDFTVGYYSSYQAVTTVSIGNVSLAAFLDETTAFNTLDVNAQIDAVHALRDSLDAIVSVFENLGCGSNGR